MAFYNVGIQLLQVNSRKWPTTEDKLAEDIIKAATMHELDILCLSELGEVGVGIGGNLPEGGVIAWIHKLLTGSAVSPVKIYADGHYATLVLFDRMNILQYQVINGFVPTQPGRCFQHFRVCTSECDMPISIVNCHAPSSRKWNLTACYRDGSSTRRQLLGDQPVR